MNSCWNVPLKVEGGHGSKCYKWNVTNTCYKGRVTNTSYKWNLCLESPVVVIGGQDLTYFLNVILILLCFWMREVITMSKTTTSEMKVVVI